MSKIKKYFLGILAFLFVLYFSVNIQNLEKYRALHNNKAFDAIEYANNFWETNREHVITNAPEISMLLKNLEENSHQAFEKYGYKLGISNTWYLFLKGIGTIESVENEYLIVSIDEQTKIRVASEFIFGNAVRDGSGQININDFLNMTDFNNVSVSINKLVKEKVISQMKKTAMPGKVIDFAGATEVKEDNIKLDSLRIIPVMANIIDGTTN